MIRFNADPELIIAQAGDEAQPAKIAGIAVPWEPVSAVVSDGTRVAFKRGAFDVTAKPAKLVENHDLTQLRGTVSISDGEEGLEFEATFANTAAARDAIELVKAGAYDSVSVGANPVKYKYDKNGTMIVSEAQLIELSLVAVPAFSQAVITEIAASAEEDADNPTQEGETEVSENTPTVEAEAPATIPTQPIYAAAARPFVMPSAAEYISKFLQGGSEWAEFDARLRAAAPDVVTTDTPGVLPKPIVTPVYNSLRGIRPVIDAIGVKAMPQGGKVFIRPEVTTHTTIGASNGENVALDAGTFVVSENQVTKAVYGGYVKVSEETMDWSQPEIVQLILDDMARAYAQETDNVAADNLVTGASTTTNFTVADIAKPAEWARWMYTAAESILTATKYLPSHLFLSANMWRALGLLVDDQKRPLFPQVGPMNAFGSMNPAGTQTSAFGLTVVVDANFANDTVIVGVPDGYEIFEQQKGAISAEANDGSLSRTIAFRGYLATLMIEGAKFRKAAFV
jgi:HK97 family phage prohead protease